ncbi:mycofactocin precursor [Prauserella shujinwangii]|uniref:Mycofactocin n=1 Tax=Prauserella shujinwangii TaxID=1453103 RepID=A0A2T0M2G5_9PSEU|nr:mycofactocin precursor MftA [Prauserella shujinwangii]PRX50916.1 mycofactocin precursor [Prauserella shujinwangii]
MDEPENTEVTDAVVEEDLLVEEVSIDGMCGVY